MSQHTTENSQPRKRTITELAQDAPGNKERKTGRDKFPIRDWEPIGGAMQFRSTAIQKRNFAEDQKEPQVEKEPIPEPQSQDQEGMSQPQAEHQSHIEEKTCPIGVLKEHRNEDNAIQREIQIKARNSDLSDTEKLILRRIKIERGYSQHCEFVNLDARYVFR